MDDQVLALVKAIHCEEIERLQAAGKMPLMPWEEPTTPYTELPEMPLESPIYREWNTYRRVAGEFIAVGLEGVWVAIREDAILGIYPNARTACYAFANASQGIRESILIKQIIANERESTLDRLKSRCPNSPIPLAKTA